MNDLIYLARCLGGQLSGSRILCPGPGHSAQDRSLSVWFDRQGKMHVNSFANDDWQTCMDYVRLRCGLPAFDQQDRERVELSPFFNHRGAETTRERNITLAGRLWTEAVCPFGTLVEDYLRARGLQLPEEAAGRCIRFHESCPWDGKRVAAMICRYEAIKSCGTASVVAIHRTALRGDGKGHLGKKALGPTRGSVIKLSPDDSVCQGLALAEGIETSLACWQRGWRPIWAAGSAGTMRTLTILPGVNLTLLADHDQSGLTAAQECGERWATAGQEACIRWPIGLGRDYADEAAP